MYIIYRLCKLSMGYPQVEKRFPQIPQISNIISTWGVFEAMDDTGGH